MSTQPKNTPQRFIIPRFQNIALVVLNYGNFEVTARQLTVLMLCALIAFNIFSHVAGLPFVVRLILAGLPVLVLLPFGWLSIQGRTLDAWLLVVLRYRLQPKICIWQRRGGPDSATTQKGGTA